MPYININTSVSVPEGKFTAVEAGCHKAVSSCLGKGASWVMVCIEDGCKMRLGGKDAPCAMVEVKNYGPLSRDKCERMSAQLTEMLSKELGISSDGIYIVYNAQELWAWNGGLF